MKQHGDDDRLYPDTTGQCSDCEHLQIDGEGDIYCDIHKEVLSSPIEMTCERHKSIRRNYKL